MMRNLNYNRMPVFLATIVLIMAITLGILASEPTSEPLGVERGLDLDPAFIEARAALVYDPLSGEIVFGKREADQLPLASLTKIITAYFALESGRSGEVTITTGDLRQEGDTGLIPGESWKLSDLVSFALVTSSNDAIAAAARAAQINPVNSSAALAELDLRQTFAMNPTGLDFSDSTAGAYGSALDIAKLFSLLLLKHPEVVTPTATEKSVYESLSGKEHLATSTGKPIIDVPNLIALKTGFTDLAGGNLVVAFDRDIGRPLIAVVLGSSYDGRFEDMRTLITKAREAQL